jgi:hypothetical protein
VTPKDVSGPNAPKGVPAMGARTGIGKCAVDTPGTGVLRDRGAGASATEGAEEEGEETALILRERGGEWSMTSEVGRKKRENTQ